MIIRMSVNPMTSGIGSNPLRTGFDIAVKIRFILQKELDASPIRAVEEFKVKMTSAGKFHNVFVKRPC